MIDVLLNQLWAVVGVIAVSWTAAGLVIWLLFVARKRWRKRFREPFFEGILRPPGWGGIERRIDALMDFGFYVGFGVALWAAIAGFIMVERGPVATGICVAAVPMSVWGISRIQQIVMDARKEKLGILGEFAVAESLGVLASRGWRVFHDVPMEGKTGDFNVDHVAVGPGGVWAIETKTYSKPRMGGKASGELRVRGEVVCLPDGRRKEPLKQARRQAAALRDWLVEEGANVTWVNALVVLPGWEVFYPQDAAPEIRDPRNVAAYLTRQEARMGEEERARVAGLLERKCRVLRFEEERC